MFLLLFWVPIINTVWDFPTTIIINIQVYLVSESDILYLLFYRFYTKNVKKKR